MSKVGPLMARAVSDSFGLVFLTGIDWYRQPLGRWRKGLALSALTFMSVSAATFTTTVQGVSNTQAILSYSHSGSCTIAISESSTHSPVVPDVDGTLFTGADTDTSRTDALISGSFKIVPVGKRLVSLASDNVTYYSRALQAFTPHYGLITCGSDTSTFSFTTTNIPPGVTRNDIPATNPSTNLWDVPTWTGARNQEIVDSQTGLLYKRQTIPSDVLGSPNYGLTQGFGAFSRPHTNTMFTSTDGKQGYVSCYWDTNGGGAMFFFIPSTGETRFIGDTGSIINPKMNDDLTFVQFRSDLTPVGLYLEPYAGGFMTGDFVLGTPRLISANSSGGACFALSILDPTRFPNVFADYNCVHVPTYANQYTSFFFANTGYSAQDAPGVEGVMWGGDGRAYDSTCSAGPVLCPHAVAAFIIGSPSNPNGCVNHNNLLWSTNLVQMNLKSNDGSCIGGFSSTVFWNFITDPTGASITTSQWGFGGHDDFNLPGAQFPNGTGGSFPNGPTIRVEEASSFVTGPNGNAYDVVIGNPQSGTLGATPTVAVGAYNPFANTLGPGNFGLVRHPTWDQDPLQAQTQAASTFWDYVPYGGGGFTGTLPDSIISSLALVMGKTRTYKVGLTQPIHIKQQDTVARTASNMLVNISGPSSVLGDSSGDAGKLCIAYVANECLTGSSAGDIYFNYFAPLDQLGCYGSEGTNNSQYDICIMDASMQMSQLGQYWGTGGFEAANKSRMLGHALAPSTQFVNALATAKSYPDASWISFPTGLFISVSLSNMWAAKVPAYPPADTINRTDFVNVPVHVPSGMASSVMVKFGYLENSPSAPANSYCTTRAEACVAGAGVSPYAFVTTDSLTPTSCSSGCVVNIPAISGRLLYYIITDGSGIPIGSEQAVIVP